MVKRQDASTGNIIEDGKAPESVAEGLMHVKVYSPYKVYFDENAASVSAANNKGPFDILPNHHNFITLINAGQLIVRAPRGDQKIAIDGGLMHIKANQVIVFLSI